jgi:hypothetical protein
MRKERPEDPSKETASEALSEWGTIRSGSAGQLRERQTGQTLG